MTYDVVVVGAGPAGAATARRLAMAGRSVLLLERGRFDRPRPGETLAPSVRSLLDGVWFTPPETGGPSDPLPSWGVRSAWGDAAPAERSHLGNVHGHGWHVDRREFDLMLARAAAAVGAELRLGTAVGACAYDGSRWSVATPAGSVACRVLVDATGRRAGLGRVLGARRIAFDRLTALAGTVDVRDEGYLLVETSPDGWWYSAPLPGGRLVAMLMTDADLCRRDRLATRWGTRLAPLTAARVGGARPARVRVYPSASHRLLRSGDRRPWVAVGDAALAVDPVSGSGVVRALRSAAEVSGVVERLLADPGDVGALESYEAGRDRECTAYLTERALYYRIERRFDTPFWARRGSGGADRGGEVVGQDGDRGAALGLGQPVRG